MGFVNPLKKKESPLTRDIERHLVYEAESLFTAWHFYMHGLRDRSIK